MAEDSLKHKTKTSIYWKFFEQFSTTVLSFFVGIVMARILSPEDYGITALPAVFIAIAGIFMSSGFGQALIRKPEISESDLSTAFYYSIGMGAFMYTCLFFAAPWIADFYNTPVLIPLIRISTLTFLFGPISTPQSVILQRRLDFKTTTKVTITISIFSAIVSITLAYNGLGLWALVINGLLCSILRVALMWFIVRWIPKTPWSKESFKYLWDYGSKMIVADLIERIYQNITPIFIGKYYSPRDLGVYNRAVVYAQLPSFQVTGVIEGVTFPVLSKLQGDTHVLGMQYRRMLKVTAFVVFPMLVLLSALARPLVIMLVTSKWEECIPYLQLLCFSYMWYPVHSINLNLLRVKGRSDLFLRLEVIKKILLLSVMAITLPMGIIPFLIGGICNSILCLIINTYYTGKLINVGFFTQMKDLVPILLLALTAGVSAFSITIVVTNMYLQIILGGLCGLSLYLGFAWLLKFEQLQDVKYMLNRKVK